MLGDAQHVFWACFSISAARRKVVQVSTLMLLINTPPHSMLKSPSPQPAWEAGSKLAALFTSPIAWKLFTALLSQAPSCSQQWEHSESMTQGADMSWASRVGDKEKRMKLTGPHLDVRAGLIHSVQCNSYCSWKCKPVRAYFPNPQRGEGRGCWSIQPPRAKPPLYRDQNLG